MADLRTELEMYASADEPPMRTTFDEVFTAARRKRQRRRSLSIAGGVAVLAAVAVAVPIIFRAAAPPAPPIAPAPTPPPSLGTGCPPRTEREAQLRCILDKFLAEELPSVRWQQATADATQSNHLAAASTADESSTVKLFVKASYTPDTCETSAGPLDTCEQRVGPHGERVLIIGYPRQNAPGRVLAVRAYSGTSAVTVTTSENTPAQILDADQMIRLGTTPELVP